MAMILGSTNEEILAKIRALPDNMKIIDLSGAPLSSLEGVVLPSSLRELDLSDTNLTSLEGIVFPQFLRRLDLSYTGITSLENVALPKGLQQLDLSNTPLTRLGDIGSLCWLQELDLSETKLSSLDGVEFPQQLHELDISYTELPSLAGAILPERLHILTLDVSLLENLPDGILPIGLHELYIDGTEPVRLPESLRSLRSLVTLELSDLVLLDLPDWLPELKLPFVCEEFSRGICLENTIIKGIDMSIFDQSQEAILQWFEERRQARLAAEAGLVVEEDQPLNELKVVFLGDGGAGKSHTIARLLKDGEQSEDFPNVSTPGIVIKDKLYRFGDKEVKVHYWDFGGQDILHSMHRMFLTKRTLYVVMVNVRDGNQDERARYWLHNLRSFADGAPVLLVLNQMDMNENASVNESDLRKLYPNLATDIAKISTLTYSDEQFQEKFIDVLLGQIETMDILDFPFTAAWRSLKDRLQGMTESYIFGDDFRKYCEECGVKGSDTVRRDLLNWFSDLGVSFCYSDSASLEDYVVLRPDWITNAIYIILFNKMDAVKNGLVRHEDIYRMLSSEDMEAVRRTVATARYKSFEVDYVLKVFRKFRLSFLVKDGEEFLPMLCNANTTDDAAEYETDPTALEFWMYYEYLPNNVIHRLMVDRRNELDLDNVWLTGARFVYDNTGLSAVVKSEDKLIRVIVKKDTTKGVQPQFYLDALKDDLERISREMGLTVTGTEVVYKTADKVAHFDYEELLYAQQEGDTHIRSKALGGRVAIADILKQSDHPADEAKIRFIHALTNACVKLQDNRNYWLSNMNDKQKKTCEDDRTTYLRDMLSASGFICLDQHFTGDAAGGHRAGELDLDIRLESDIHWTALEALNLNGAELSNWEKHLDKLLKHYNQSGITFLFHVGYLTCAEEIKFNNICLKFWENMRTYMPNGMRVLSAREFPLERPKHDAPAFIQAMECVYDCGSPITVYHFFVRMHP